jgi:hypothetical protein
MGYVTITTKCTELGASPPGTRVEMSQVGGYHYIIETDEILSVNPPDPRREVSCTSFSAVSIKCYFCEADLRGDEQ